MRKFDTATAVTEGVADKQTDWIQAALHLILPDRLHIMNLASIANAAG